MIATKPFLPTDIALLLRRGTIPLQKAVKHNILLVGCNTSELQKIAGFFGCSQHFLLAKNATAAMDIIDRQPVHLIIAGPLPGDMSGVQFCERLKSSPNYSHLPVVLISGKITRLNGLNAGADAMLDVPLCSEMVVAQVKNLLANRERLRNHYATIHSGGNHNDNARPNGTFIKELHRYIDEHMANECFSVDCLAKYMNMSRPTLYRKVQSVLKITPNELINNARLKKAVELLATSKYQVCEIAKMVGFNSRSNFGKAFIKKFNLTPSAYQQLKRGF